MVTIKRFFLSFIKPIWYIELEKDSYDSTYYTLICLRNGRQIERKSSGNYINIVTELFTKNFFSL